MTIIAILGLIISAWVFTSHYTGYSLVDMSKECLRLAPIVCFLKGLSPPKIDGIHLHKFRRMNGDIGLLVSEVAARLRSGNEIDQAWKKTLERIGVDGDWQSRPDEWGVPPALRLLVSRSKWRRPSVMNVLGVSSAVAVCRLCHITGAPAADIYESCASGISDSAEAVAARRGAPAGPITSAKMLAALPLLGLALGAGIGARPVQFLSLCIMSVVSSVSGAHYSLKSVEYSGATV